MDLVTFSLYEHLKVLVVKTTSLFIQHKKINYTMNFQYMQLFHHKYYYSCDTQGTSGWKAGLNNNILPAFGH
jgi:hypothetical protein